MTERCRNCGGDLRLARMPLCDVERVDICENCGRLYLGGECRLYETRTETLQPVDRPRRRRRVAQRVEMLMN
jgi:hypothetical protein